MQAELVDDSVRDGLIAILPRLKRFAEVLIGARGEGTAFLSRALVTLLEQRQSYQYGTPFDRWAFAGIYRYWLQELRGHADPVRRSRLGELSFADLVAEERGTVPDLLTVSFLANLPPQQRLTLLLVYGEGFSHEDAALVLDCAPDTIAARLNRASTALADKLGETEEEPDDADVKPLYPVVEPFHLGGSEKLS